MKAWKTVVKIVVAVAAVAGIVYLAAAYGDRLVAWAKKMIRGSECDCDCEWDCDCDCDCDDALAEQVDFEG